ncbi:14-3-3 protein [Dothidotthia symphoricarpi CBS 119687]|uniref:14-3-3 protein n=1 Tax=Dothidotthia symphoricarpi CBS 119687 TaxID=1392245 RepID=A0A6A6AM47_9PLEO|nr:14-3-3 protein [Dothidotthia symphoricarpi CBS 119687]KAF2131551.1 14-3-3 protein [Dothidotthia symphoricarpi CBS 119687]
MASLDFDQKFLGRIAKQTAESNPYLSDALYQILGLSVLLSRRLIRARKLRKLDTSRDTPSLAAYQHILWLSREGLSILELHILPYAQDNQHGPECRVLSVKLRASFYHIFCLFHNHPPVTATNMESTDPRIPGAPPIPASPQRGNGQGRKMDATGLSPPSKRTGRQPALREPVDSIVSETSFVTNPYSAGGPVGTPSPGPTINAPPGLNPIPIPQPSSFILPPLNFVPLASGYFSTATSYASSFLVGSHPLRLSVALEHSAFLWDCLHDHEASRRVARRAIKDVYRAQEAMDDTEFEDAAELVSILGRMMKRKSWEGTPRVGGMSSPEPSAQDGVTQRPADSNRNGAPTAPVQQNTRRAAEGPPITITLAPQDQPRGSERSRSNSTSKPAVPRPKEPSSHETTPRSNTHRHTGSSSQDTTPRTRQASQESHATSTPRGSSRTQHQHHHHSSSSGSQKTSTSDAPPLRRSPPLRNSPTHADMYPRPLGSSGPPSPRDRDRDHDQTRPQR